MEFKKYTSIENSYREPFIEKIRESLEYLGCKNMQFSVSEKVDGCNVSLITDGKTLIPGKRTSTLSIDDKFYGFQNFAEDRLKEKSVGVFCEIEGNNPDVESIQIFGEFFGGYYKDMKSNVPRIQKGIDYCPYHEFYAFDILMTYVDGNTEWVGVDECNRLFEKYGFFHNKELFRGTLDECLAYSPIFISTIGERLGLPYIENNFAEGVVIKPVTPIFFANGERIIIKNKNPKFEEFEKKDKSGKAAAEYSEQCGNCIAAFEDYCTESRLGNVMSHLGELEMPKQMGLVIKEYSADVIEEFLKDHPEYNALPTNEQKTVNKALNRFAANIIKRKF